MAKFGKSIVSDDVSVEVNFSQPTAAPTVTVAAAPPPPAATVAPTTTPTPTPVSAAAPTTAAPAIEFTPMSPEKAEESWVKSMWRPAMGWLYMLICLMDFVVFPAIAMFLPVMLKGIGITMNYAAWQSLTLSNGGLIHMAFGAILGVAAYGRTQEKVASKQ